MVCTIRFLTALLSLEFAFSNSQKLELENEIQAANSSKSCCDCDYSDLLTRFLDALGNDELARRFEIRGIPGPPGPIGPEGLMGKPGRKGEIGLPGPAGERGYRGKIGKPGKQGQKGEPGDILVYRQLAGQRVIQLKGEKGSDGLRGLKGEQGVPGLTVVGQKGEAGTPFEITEELKLSIKGEKGERGYPGRSINCQHCYRSRRKKLEKEIQSDQAQKIYIPVQGPPGKDIVGSPGPKGEQGEPGRVTKSPVAVLSYEDELSKFFDPYSLGTLAYVRATETLFIQTDRGWKEITFSGRFIDPYAHRRRHTKNRN